MSLPFGRRDDRAVEPGEGLSRLAAYNRATIAVDRRAGGDGAFRAVVAETRSQWRSDRLAESFAKAAIWPIAIRGHGKGCGEDEGCQYQLNDFLHVSILSRGRAHTLWLALADGRRLRRAPSGHLLNACECLFLAYPETGSILFQLLALCKYRRDRLPLSCRLSRSGRTIAG